jgi:hypothetical protein
MIRDELTGSATLDGSQRLLFTRLAPSQMQPSTISTAESNQATRRRTTLSTQPLKVFIQV